MIAAFICVVSLAFLLQFFIAYSRSVIAAYAKSELSDQVREVAGLEGEQIKSEQFGRLLQLVRLCPQKKDDEGDLAVVRVYYELMGWLGTLARSVAPGVRKWAERERISCTYFAAVALDRRIAYSRALLAQQMSEQ
jgi:hypothetical protein